MTGENRITNIKMEIALGDEARNEAKVLLERGLPKGAISRTYYFVFHYVRGLLYSLGLEARSHEGVGHLLNLHFIKPGKLPPACGKLFCRLQKYREQADYDPALVFTIKDVEEELREAEDLSDRILDYLKKERYLKDQDS